MVILQQYALTTHPWCVLSMIIECMHTVYVLHAHWFSHPLLQLIPHHALHGLSMPILAHTHPILAYTHPILVYTHPILVYTPFLHTHTPYTCYYCSKRIINFFITDNPLKTHTLTQLCQIHLIFLTSQFQSLSNLLPPFFLIFSLFYFSQKLHIRLFYPQHLLPSHTAL